MRNSRFIEEEMAFDAGDPKCKVPFLYAGSTGKLVRQDLRLSGWVDAFNAWNVHCGDINGDGYDDFWFEELRWSESPVRPLIFLNDRAGGFARAPNAAFPAVKGIPPRTLLNSIVGDFDGDGITDYVVYANMLPYDYNGLPVFRYLRGSRRLNVMSPAPAR